MPKRPTTSFTMLVSLLAGLLLALPAQAQSARDWNLPPGQLTETLNQLGRQAGILLFWNAELTNHRQSAGLTGQYTTQDALLNLLQGTGILAIPAGENTWRLEVARPATDSSFTLPALQIRGQQLETDLPYQTPGSVNVLTQRDIERFRGTSVGDIFQGVAGVLVSENRNSGGLDVNIRGMQGQGRVPVLVDGARQETTVYRGYAGVVGRSYLDPDLIGSVRIEKGPVMTAEATGAVGGVVNVHTLGAEEIIKPGKDWGIRLRGSLIGNNSGNPPASGTRGGYSSWNDDSIYRIDCERPDICNQPHPNGKRTYALLDNFASQEGMNRPGLLTPKSHAASLALAKRFEWGALIAAYAERSQGNYYAGKNGPGAHIDISEVSSNLLFTEVRAEIRGASRFRAEERIINSNNDSQSWLLKSQLYLPSDQTWEVSYLRYDSSYGELMPSQLLWFGAIEQTRGSEVTVHTYTSRYHWDPVAYDWADLKFNLWHTDTETKNSNYSDDMLDTGVAPPIQTELYTRWGGDLSNRLRFYSWGETQLSFGLAIQQEKVQPENRELNNQVGGFGILRDGNRNEYSAFAAIQYQPIAEITLDAGIRYTRFDSEDNRATGIKEGSEFCIDEDGDGRCDPLYHKNSNSGTAPIIALTYEPWRGVQFYARYAEALRMPSLFEGSGGASVAPSFEIGLRPEHAYNRELGFNYLQQDLLTAGDKLGFKLAYFKNHISDYLTRTNSNNWETEPGAIAGVMRNINSADFNGWEVSLDYDAGWLFTSLSATRYDQIEICHYGSFRRYECTDYGVANSYINNMIPPPYHGSATLGTRLFQEKLEMGLRSTWMGKRTSPEYNNDTRRGWNAIVPWHSYQLLDLFITWQPNDTFTLDFNIDNLTDRYYLDALSLGLVPAPGRTARLGATLHF